MSSVTFGKSRSMSVLVEVHFDALQSVSCLCPFWMRFYKIRRLQASHRSDSEFGITSICLHAPPTFFSFLVCRRWRVEEEEVWVRMSPCGRTSNWYRVAGEIEAQMCLGDARSREQFERLAIRPLSEINAAMNIGLLSVQATRTKQNVARICALLNSSLLSPTVRWSRLCTQESCHDLYK